MTTSTRLVTIPIAPTRRRQAFTLVELIASMAIMTILMGAMISVIMIATHALPDSTRPTQKKLVAMEVLDQIASELFYATAITEESSTAVTFTVADRGHGTVGPETIRYAWSGIAGDPLTRQYNGGTVVNVIENPQLFQLTYQKGAGRLKGYPNILYLHDPATLGPRDSARLDVLAKWNFPTQLLSPGSAVSAIEAAKPNCDVVYVTSETTVDVSPVIKNWPKGIVCEDGTTRLGLGIGNSSMWFRDTAIRILDNTHEITAPFAVGAITIVNSSQNLMATWQGLAPGAELLAQDPGLSYDALVTIDIGRTLLNGGTAAGRRVALPWGFAIGFDFQALNEDGLALLKRSIAWAAVPPVYTDANIVLQPTGVPELLRTRVQFLNTLEVTAP